jgi:type VI secretion system protein ImpK
MIATSNQQKIEKHSSAIQTLSPPDPSPQQLKSFTNSPIWLPSRMIVHHPKAGLNPMVDAAGHLFSTLGKLKRVNGAEPFSQALPEIAQEIADFEETVSKLGYNPEYRMVCRYILCATFDDILHHLSLDVENAWGEYALLNFFNQDKPHKDKFFSILDRAIKEPSLYIDLMEFIYICLSMGYKGQYRVTDHGHFQLEQMTNQLYQQIRLYRGNFSKSLSPPPFKKSKSRLNNKNSAPISLLFIFFITTCIIMSIFVGLSYLMDIISNEAYKPITQIAPLVSHTISL